MPSLSTRAVNLLMLVALTIILTSGIAMFIIGGPNNEIMFWAHRIASFALAPLLLWKVGIVFRSYAKRGITASTVLSALSGVLFILAFVYGLLWATVGVGGGRLPVLGLTSGLGLHVTFGLAFVPLLIIHVINRWPQVRARVPDFTTRRNALRYLTLGAFGLVVWRSTEAATARAGWSGAERSYTGSKPRGRFTGNDYPTVNWLSDPRPAIDADAWTLRIDGLVENELLLSMDDFSERPIETHTAILDCTGGWFTEQHWTGVRVRDLLEEAKVRDSARSIVFHSETGYRRRYALRRTNDMLLALQVGDEPLSRGHGYPVRLVVPGERGYGWVKWVVRIEASELPGWFESPLPLQ
jgi:hypothetical protein